MPGKNVNLHMTTATCGTNVTLNASDVLAVTVDTGNMPNIAFQNKSTNCSVIVNAYNVSSYVCVKNLNMFDLHFKSEMFHIFLYRIDGEWVSKV